MYSLDSCEDEQKKKRRHTGVVVKCLHDSTEKGGVLLELSTNGRGRERE